MYRKYCTSQFHLKRCSAIWTRNIALYGGSSVFNQCCCNVVGLLRSINAMLYALPIGMVAQAWGTLCIPLGPGPFGLTRWTVMAMRAVWRTVARTAGASTTAPTRRMWPSSAILMQLHVSTSGYTRGLCYLESHVTDLDDTHPGRNYQATIQC